MCKIIIIDGPNINLTGLREQSVYGSMTYGAMKAEIIASIQTENCDIHFFQSNHEGYIIDELHKCIGEYDGVVINPGAYTHYSYGIADAIKAISLPVIEVHMTNIYNRDEFRKNSVTASSCIGQICGFGWFGYVLGIKALIQRIRKAEGENV